MPKEGEKMNFLVPKSTFEITLTGNRGFLGCRVNSNEKTIVVLTKTDPEVEEWGDYEVDVKAVVIQD